MVDENLSLFDDVKAAPRKRRGAKPGPKSLAVTMERSVVAARDVARGRHIDQRLMGLDLSLAHTGMVILTEHGYLLRSLTLDHPMAKKGKGRREIDAEETDRLLEIANEVVGYAKDFGVGHVVAEGFAHAARFQAHQLGELSGVVRTQLRLARGLYLRKIPPLQARKEVLGYGGRLTKRQIMDAVVGGEIQVGTEHEADAWVAAFAFFLAEAVR